VSGMHSEEKEILNEAPQKNEEKKKKKKMKKK
jgi:hypothetical protein